MRLLWQYTKEQRPRFLWGCLLLVLTNATTMALPQLFGVLVDGVNEGIDRDTLLTIAGLMLLLAAGGAVFRVLSRVHLFYGARNVEMRLRSEYYQVLTSHSASFYAEHPTGDLMSRATNDLTQARMILGPGLLNIVNSAVAFAVAIPFMWAISPSLAALAIGILLPSLIVTQQLSHRLYRHHRAVQESMGSLSSFVQENLAGAHVVRTFGMEEQQQRRFAEYNEDYLKAAISLSFTRSYLWRLMTFFAGIGMLAVVWVGSLQVVDGSLSLGQLVAEVEYLALLAWPSFALGWVLGIWQRGKAAMSRVGEIFKAPTEIPIHHPATAAHETVQTLQPSISVSGLSLEFADRKVLDGIDVDVAAGETLGIVGPIGAGKSMLLRCLVRGVPISAGRIEVGGEAIDTMDVRRLRTTFGFVHQTPLLFSKTVEKNVTFGRPNATREEAVHALERAAFARDLQILPQGIDTPVGERGVTLSGGQKQRTAIARALLLDPPVLVLDDSLSAVDAETEAEIVANIRRDREGRTTIIVAHRLSAVVHADHIIVLDDGKIIERGDHDSLVADGGLYATLLRRQQLESEIQAVQKTSA